MKDEIAQVIANELRLIREELQRLTGAIKSSANRSGNPMPATLKNRIRHASHSRPSLGNREGRNNSGPHAAENRDASGIFQKIRGE
jgi:hypothetical protein